MWSTKTSVFYGTNPVWKCRIRRDNVVHIKCGSVEFRDSYQLLPLSLAVLDDNLPSKARVVQKILSNTPNGKALYPYNWFDTV